MPSFMTFWRTILRQFRRNMLQTVGAQMFALLTASIAVLVFAFFYLIYTNLVEFGSNLDTDLTINVYLSEDPSEALKTRIREKITHYDGAKSIEFISSAEAYDELATQLGERRVLLSGLPVDFLPSVIRIQPTTDVSQLSNIDTFIDYLYELPTTLEVQYGQEWVQRFQKFVYVLRALVVLSALLLIIALAYTVAYIIRLTVASRRAELQYLSLIGSGTAFVRLPFILEGIFQGFAGSILGISSLYAVFKLLQQSFVAEGVSAYFTTYFLTLTEIGAIVLGAVFFCGIGSLAATRGFALTKHPTEKHRLSISDSTLDTLN